MFARWFGYKVQVVDIEVVDGDSINWRRGGWGDGKQDGTRKIRLHGLDAPAVGGKAKNEQEAQWGAAAKAFLETRIAEARRLKLRPTGKRTPHYGDELMVLTIDGEDIAGIMIRERMAKESAWTAEGRFVRYDWADLWDERPECLR
jgi:endonuclease YncB( thermonuclease family)